MLAKDFETGKKFKHKLLDDYVVVIELEGGNKMFETTKYGDRFLYLDESNFEEIS